MDDADDDIPSTRSTREFDPTMTTTIVAVKLDDGGAEDALSPLTRRAAEENPKEQPKRTQRQELHKELAVEQRVTQSQSQDQSQESQDQSQSAGQYQEQPRESTRPEPSSCEIVVDARQDASGSDDDKATRVDGSGSSSASVLVLTSQTQLPKQPSSVVVSSTHYTSQSAMPADTTRLSPTPSKLNDAVLAHEGAEAAEAAEGAEAPATQE